jgi:hypothetical protein
MSFARLKERSAPPPLQLTEPLTILVTKLPGSTFARARIRLFTLPPLPRTPRDDEYARALFNTAVIATYDPARPGAPPTNEWPALSLIDVRCDPWAQQPDDPLVQIALDFAGTAVRGRKKPPRRLALSVARAAHGPLTAALFSALAAARCVRDSDERTAAHRADAAVYGSSSTSRSGAQRGSPGRSLFQGAVSLAPLDVEQQLVTEARADSVAAAHIASESAAIVEIARDYPAIVWQANEALEASLRQTDASAAAAASATAQIVAAARAVQKSRWRGALAGGSAGAASVGAAGALAGAAVCSVVPGVGTAIGAVGGGALGAILGGGLGAVTGGVVVDRL